MAATYTRNDIDLQRSHDGKRGINWHCVQARINALLEARDADGLEERGGSWALRQAFIDLSSACEESAARMPRPSQPQKMKPKVT